MMAAQEQRATGDSRIVDAAELRYAMGQFATGVTIVTTVSPDGQMHGMTVNSVTSVSLRPPMILTCLNNGSRTLAAIEQSGIFAVTLLAHEQQSLASHFAGARTDADWESLPFTPGAQRGAPVFHEGLMSLECEVHRIDEGGDHRIVLGQVVAVTQHRTLDEPLLFFESGFRRLRERRDCASAARSRRRANAVAFQVHEGCVPGGVLGGLWCTCGAESDTMATEPTELFADVD
jgi:flavin reductase (DIM6/NTAB) family NADH-FMN oxidoreductase RutF